MQPSKKSTASLLISLFLLGSGIVLFVTAFFLGLTAFLPLIVGNHIEARSAIFGFVYAVEAFILFAAAYLCFQKYLERSASENPTRFSFSRWHILILVIGASLTLLVGYFIEEYESINWLILPIVTIPAVLFPIGLFFGFGAQKIELGPRWRVWGIFGLGMTLGPILLIVLEVAVLIFVVLLLAFYFASNPQFTGEIVNLGNQVNRLQNDPQRILELLIPYALKPGVIILVISYFALIVPFIEELLKPIGVWFFAAKLESRAQGFALGALSGAAYSLIESLGSSGQTMGWASLLATRIGTSLLHITTTALMGWAIASLWKDRKVLKFIAVYFSSSVLHGVWNAGVMMYSFSNLAKEFDPGNLLGSLSPLMIAISLTLIIVLFVILIQMNRNLGRTNGTDASADLPIDPTDGRPDQPGVVP